MKEPRSGHNVECWVFEAVHSWDILDEILNNILIFGEGGGVTGHVE
jgi:hypothetical protein